MTIRGCLCERNRYWIVLWISLGILILQGVGSYLSKSLALFSDTAHVFGDFTAQLVAIRIADAVYRGIGDEEQLRKRGMWLHAVLLWGAATWVVIEALGRIGHPFTVNTPLMMWVTAIGALGNLAAYLVVRKGEQNVTHLGLSWHVWSDFLQSLAVLATGGLILMTGISTIDLIAAVLLAGYMSWGGFKIVCVGNGAHAHSH